MITQRHVILDTLQDQYQTCCIPMSECTGGGRCTDCKRLYYCSRECQAVDWDAGHDTECARIQAGVPDWWNMHELNLELIGANARITDSSLSSMSISEMLGEGAFGAVFKSSDSMYAIKIQDAQSDCLREARIQNSLGKLPKVAIAKVYYYSNRITSIPAQWQRVIQQYSQKKGAAWATAGWRGNFCIMVMDYLRAEKKGASPKPVATKNMPAYAFGLIYTVQTGYDKIRFQHLDIHAGNVTTIPANSGKYTVTECAEKGIQWQFSGISRVVRLLDFGISRTRKFPTTEIFNMQVSPPEALADQMQNRGGGAKIASAGFDNYSIGLLLLNMVFSAMGGRYGTIVADMQLRGEEQLRTADPRTGIVLRICALQYAIGNGVHPENESYPPGGYEEFIHVQRRPLLEQICQGVAPFLTQLLQETERLYGKRFILLVKQLLSWNPSKRRIDLARHPYFFFFVKQCAKADTKELKNARGKKTGIVLNPSQKDARNIRLDKNVLYLYHQTNAAAAKEIVSTQKMILGSTGWAGGGIYFALTPEATNSKAHEKGVILKAKVRLGVVWYLAKTDPTMNFKKLAALGADSIVLSRPTGPEYVVYHPDQVKKITIYTGGKKTRG